jgi:hypothetical protein
MRPTYELGAQYPRIRLSEYCSVASWCNSIVFNTFPPSNMEL